MKKSSSKQLSLETPPKAGGSTYFAGSKNRLVSIPGQAPGQSSLLLLMLLLVSPIMSADTPGDQDFRVSGIMRLGGNDFRGLLEFANGEKSIVAVGDSLGAWEIRNITEHCVSLSQAGRQKEKCLVGLSDSVVLNEKKVEMESDAKDEGMSHFKNVNKTDLLQALDSLAAESGPITMEQLNSAILPLVFSEDDLRITEIDAHEVKTAQQAIEKMRQSINQGVPIRLTLKHDNVQDQEDVYYLQATP